MSNEGLLGKEPVGKLIIKLCIPSVVIMLVFVIYNMADIFFIGKTGNPMEVAAIALVGPFFSVVHAIGTLIGNGSAIGIGISLGKKEYKKVDSIGGFGVYLSLILGCILGLAVILSSHKIVYALGANHETYTYALSYIRVLSLGMPVMLVSSVMANIIRGQGGARQSMTGNLLGTLVNIVLDPLFISVFSLGTQGAAIATLLGNLVSLAYYLSYILNGQEHITLNIKHIILKKEVTFDILLLGIPMAIGTVLMSFATVFRNNLLIDYGNVAIAASGIAGRVGMLVGMLIMGIAMGIQPAISYNYGAGNMERLKEIMLKTWMVTFMVGSLLTSLMLFFRMSLVQLFIDDVEVIYFGKKFLQGALITGPLIGFYQISNTLLQGTGKVSFATFVALLRKGTAYIPILFIMNHFFGLSGIIYSSAVADTISIVIALILSFIWYRRINESLYARQIEEI